MGMEYQKYMHALMIAYYTKISFPKCASAPYVSYHNTKWMMTNVVMMQAQTMVVRQRCVGILQ